MNLSKDTLIPGMLGILFPAGGITVSILPTVEAWLRVTSLAVGITVGIVSLIKLLKKKD